MTRFRTILIGAGTSLVLALNACGNGPPPDVTAAGSSSATSAITVVTSGTAASTIKQTDDLKFDPTTATVKAGDIVGFTNSGTTPHNVTFDSGTASPTMSGGDTFLVKFSTPGTYKYVCTFHAPGMAGTITVG